MNNIYQTRDLYAVPELTADYIYIRSTNDYNGQVQTAYIEISHNGEVSKIEADSPGITVLRIDRSTLKKIGVTYHNSNNLASVIGVIGSARNATEDQFLCIVSSGKIVWHKLLTDMLVEYGYSGAENFGNSVELAMPFAFLGYKGLAPGYAICQFGKTTELSKAEISAYIVNRTFTSSKDGEPGPPGEPGEPGEPGTTFYTWIKYADALGSDGYPTAMYDVPRDSTKYLGIAFNQKSKTESADPRQYMWTRVRGEDGVDGTSFKVKGVCEDVCDYDAYLYELEKIEGKIYLIDDYDSDNPNAKALKWDGDSSIDLGAMDGDAYIKSSNKVLCVKDKGGWINLGNVQGPKGDPGPPGPPGSQGSIGPIGYPAGKWDKFTLYVRTDTITPFVEHNGGYWLLIADQAQVTEPNAENDDVWKMIPDYQAFFVNLFFANFAKIASAVISGDYQFSQYGLLNGVESTSYEKFTGPSGSFIPNLCLDFLKGEFWANKCHITGEVNATSGRFTNCQVDGTYGAPFSDMISLIGYEGTIDEWYADNFERIKLHDNVILQASTVPYVLSCTTRDSGRVLSVASDVADIKITGDGSERFCEGGVLKTSITVGCGQMVKLKGYGTDSNFKWYNVVSRIVSEPLKLKGIVTGFNDKVIIRGRVTISGTKASVTSMSPKSDVKVTRNSAGRVTISWSYGYIAGSIDNVYASVTVMGDAATSARVLSIDALSMVVNTFRYNVLVDSDFCFEIKCINNNI